MKEKDGLIRVKRQILGAGSQGGYCPACMEPKDAIARFSRNVDRYIESGLTRRQFAIGGLPISYVVAREAGRMVTTGIASMFLPQPLKDEISLQLCGGPPTPSPTPATPTPSGEQIEGESIKLPQPRKKGSLSIEEAIERRRSRRSYTDDPVLLSDISQLCWAAQGITEAKIGFRAAPSAGALYPLEIFLVVGNSDLEAGVYSYSCGEHVLERVKKGDYRNQLCEASLRQEWVEKAALDFVITAIYSRTIVKYGERGRERYVPMEAGHVAENIYLQAESLGLGTVAIGAFYDDQVREVISAPSEHVPLYVMPIGHI